jgi:hypothetical protein
MTATTPEPKTTAKTSKAAKAAVAALKHCSHCGRDLRAGHEHFAPRKTTKDGPCIYCRTCNTSAALKQYAIDHPKGAKAAAPSPPPPPPLRTTPSDRDRPRQRPGSHHGAPGRLRSRHQRERRAARHLRLRFGIDWATPTEGDHEGNSDIARAAGAGC